MAGVVGISSSPLARNANGCLVPGATMGPEVHMRFGMRRASHLVAKEAHVRNPIGGRRLRVVSAKATTLEPAALTSDSSLKSLMEAFSACTSDRERTTLLLDLSRSAPRLEKADRRDATRVAGCSARVWLTCSADGDSLRFAADSDSALHRGLCVVALAALQGKTAEEVLSFDAAEALAPLGARWGALTRSRVNGLAALLDAAKRYARRISDPAGAFPSLVIRAGGVVPKGAYAEAQARYLEPDQGRVDALVASLSSKRVGVVAHFYMDPEVQGVLASAAQRWPHVAISDSLVMADKAVAMARAGCRAITVLGVDFMSENVRAMLDDAGFADVAVYRMNDAPIGCSLAEAAESPEYDAYLAQAAAHEAPAVHVVYINTSLRTKAHAQATVPTITCTSSNVVNTVLSAYAAIPDVHVWYGPDSYMGRNVQALLRALGEGPDDAVRRLHPEHSAASVRDAVERFHYFAEGMCIVHHMFGAAVCETVRESYGDAYIAAHFEVPGEMFELGLEASRRGAGVVGSTSNILDFILSKVRQATGDVTNQGSIMKHPLKFVLGTETGMITAIVRAVRAELERLPAERRVEVEIVFPVAADAITTAEQEPGAGQAIVLPGGVSVLPGAASGEGCSSAGGCASCPYMKMNTLEALVQICDAIGDERRERLLTVLAPVPYHEHIAGQTVASLGCETILHMRDFQREKRVPERLVNDVLTRKKKNEMAG